jgi:DNA-binding response OmpR family regulator
MRVLVVEDERPLARALQRTLESEGFSVVMAANGVDGDWAAREGDFDVIVLDVMLPGMSGYDICRNLRATGDNTPILFLTAKDGEYDEADALDIGADDFVAKPFSPVVLVARLRALLRRSSAGLHPGLTVGSLRVEPERRRAWLGDQELRLTARELGLLSYLAHRADHVVSKTQILEHVWDQAFEGDANVVEVYIGHLRRKLASSDDVNIETFRGVGYRLSGRKR